MSNKKGLLNKIFRALNPSGMTSCRRKNQERVLDLIGHHPCFTELALWKTTKVDSLCITDPSKKEMTKEYLRIVCNTCEGRILKFKKMDIEQMCNTMTGTSISVMVSSVLNEINRKAAIDGIPYIFLEKVDAIVARHIEVLADSTNNLQLYRDWGNTEDRILATLDILYTYIRIIGDDVPNIVNSMNGELKMVLKGSKFDKY